MGVAFVADHSGEPRVHRVRTDERALAPSGQELSQRHGLECSASTL